jgi:ubiquinone/menaquinone biosynthesis C-methylase UbiE
MAAFDAPSAYMLVHMHHYPDKTPQAAFDALHEELDLLALKHLEVAGKLACLDVGCGVGTSTFSTARSLAKAGRDAQVTGLDLSDYFVAVGRHLAKESGSAIDFVHGNGLNLLESGFKDASCDLVTISEVTHEMPVLESRRLLQEAARVLKPGGVVAYLDLNQVQILKDNAVGALVDRVATCNEPYFDEYLELRAAQELKDAGLDVVEETWPNKQKYETFESCSLRIVIAKKPLQAPNGVPNGVADSLSVQSNGYPCCKQ